MSLSEFWRGTVTWAPVGASPFQARRRLARALLLLLGLMLFAPAHAAQTVTLQLKWTHQFQFAGYYAAKAQGYYDAAGLDVRFREARPDEDTTANVVRGEAEFGVGTSDLLLSRSQGLPVVVLGVIFQHSPLAIVALERSGIRNLHQLAGKRVMIEANSAELFAYLKREGIPRERLDLVPHNFGVDDLIDGKIDAMSAYITDEPWRLSQLDLNYSVFTPRAGGVDFYGDNLFTTSTFLRDHPDTVAQFREASLRGWKYAMEHPEQIADLIVKQYAPHKTREQLLFEAAQMRPLIQPDLIGAGYMYAGRWRHIADIYAELGMLRAGFPLEDFMYDPDTRHLPAWLVRSLAAVLVLALVAGGLAAFVLRHNRRMTDEIGQRRQAEATLRASEERYRLIYNTAPLGFILFDRDNRILDWNRYAESMFGWTRLEMIGQSIERLIPEEERVHVANVLSEARVGGAVIHSVNQNLTRGGRLIRCRWSNVIQSDEHGAPVGILALAEDITEQQRMREDLEAANKHLRAQIEQIELLQDELREQALRDPLTHLYNRRYLDDMLRHELLRLSRGDRPLSVVMVDIDRFKEINDTWGHEAGDQVLVALAGLLTTFSRGSDFVCRFGGEEFVVVMPEANGDVAFERAEAWRRAFEELVTRVEGRDIRVTFSAGVASWPDQADDAESLLRSADRALYAAKDAGRNRSVRAAGSAVRPSP